MLRFFCTTTATLKVIYFDTVAKVGTPTSPTCEGYNTIILSQAFRRLSLHMLHLTPACVKNSIESQAKRFATNGVHINQSWNSMFL